MKARLTSALSPAFSMLAVCQTVNDAPKTKTSVRPTGAPLDGRELDSTDNGVRFGKRDFSTETGRTQRTSPSVSSKTLRSEHQSDLTPLVKNLRTDWPFLVRGPAVVYDPTTAASVGELLKPHRTALHAENRCNKDWPMSADAPVGPAILLNQLGKGSALTFAASPDWATASDHHLTETRKLLANAVRLLNPAPRITIEAPATVQAVVTDDPATRTRGHSGAGRIDRRAQRTMRERRIPQRRT